MPKKDDLDPTRNMIVAELMMIIQKIVNDLYARIEKLEEHIKNKQI